MSETGSDFPPHKVVILAAGKGTRMKPQGTPEQELDPKVLIPFLEGNLIGSVLEAIDLSIIKSTPVIVVGFKADQVMDTLGRDRYNFVRQEKQLGTGHAVASAVEAVRDSVFTLVLYGDMPLIDAATINRIIEAHMDRLPAITMATVTVPNFEDEYAGFNDFGRVIRDNAGNVVDIVERKNATPEQLGIKTVNPSIFCFDTAWLIENVGGLTDENKQGEFLLTDMVKLAASQGKTVSVVDIAPEVTFGVNTPEQLTHAQAVAKSSTA